MRQSTEEERRKDEEAVRKVAERIRRDRDIGPLEGYNLPESIGKNIRKGQKSCKLD